MNILYSYEAGSTYEHIVYEEQRDDCGLRSKGLDFIDDLGASGGSMTTAGGGHRKRKTVERGLEDLHGVVVCAPLNIYPFYGKGWESPPAPRAGRGACSCARVDRLVFRVKLEAGLFSLKIE